MQSTSSLIDRAKSDGCAGHDRCGHDRLALLFVAYPDVWSTCSDELRPPPDETPAEFAARHRVLHAEYCTEHPGPWDNRVFPYQDDVMNVVQEAMRTGKRVAFMKAGQIGGTDCMINGLLWCKRHYPGPQLFLTSTEKVAEEFGRERFDPIIRDMEPLRKKLIIGERGQILVKRFVDGRLQLCGGQSVFNLQSTPYRVVTIDEADSLAENLGGDGDPVKMAIIRLKSFSGETTILAYAHPTRKERGVGKIYYADSDQRRPHITHRCGREFWQNWFETVKVIPKSGQTPEQAERGPDCYHLVCPGCGATISEPERIAMLRAGVRQKSVLPPEEAAKKEWIGVHASQLETPHHSIRAAAVEWIATDCGRDENAARVFVNKYLGDVYEPKVKQIDLTALRSLIVVPRRQNDPEYYQRGQVPPAVLFLTAGQDSRSTEFHYTIWGWGVRESIEGSRLLCGWLIDWGEIKRQYALTFTEAEYGVFDDLIYNLRFPCTDGQRFFHVRGCAHDVGWEPTQLPIIRYCRQHRGRAMPCKGASEDHSSASLAPPYRLGTARRHKAGDVEVIDDPQLLLNTHLLKTDWYGWVDQRLKIQEVVGAQVIGTREVPRITLPGSVDELARWLEQSKNEELAKGDKGEFVWKKKGPNHFADCNTYAYGVALYFEPHARNMTAEEYGQRRSAQKSAATARGRRPERGQGEIDPAMG